MVLILQRGKTREHYIVASCRGLLDLLHMSLVPSKQALTMIKRAEYVT